MELTFHINSINTGTAQFDKHLQSAEILMPPSSPRLQFVGDKFTYEGDKLTAVSATLTIKGQDPARDLQGNQFACYDSPMLKREVCGGDFETHDRSHGLWRGLWRAVRFSGKNVRIVAQIEAIKQ